MSAVDTLKQFEQMAFQDYEEKIDNTNIERPPEEELFSDNKATAAIVTKVIEHDAETERILAAQKENVYAAKSSQTSSKKTFGSEVKTAEVKSDSSWGSNSSYKNGYSYGGYNTGYGYGYGSASKQQTEEEKKRKEYEELQAEINKIFKEACEEAFDTDNSDIKNIFEIEEETSYKRAIHEAQAKNGGAYTKEQKKMKRKLNLMVFGLRMYSIAVVSLKNAIKNVK